MERESDRWQARPPADLQEHVAWPLRVEAHHDDGAPASKWRGYDDDDQPVAQLLREEEFEAWRTRLGPWVRRVQRQGGEFPPCRSRTDSGFELVPANEIPRL